MKKIYELWLDESGQFVNENKLKDSNLKPSLVGGLLVEKDIADIIPYDELIDSQNNHAMHLNNSKKKEYVLPLLERMQEEYRATQVFFENAEYADAASGRQLYLRIIAEGLLQLMQTLNARSESVELSVLIAQRQDVDAPKEHRRILSEEYQNALRTLIEKKRQEHKIFLHEDSKLDFQIKVANSECKLQLADFACNTRLTRDSLAFRDVRDRVSRLHDSAYIFTLSEMSSVNYIKRSLANGSISDAIMELYTSKDDLNHKEELALIVERMQNTNYRLLKSQMKQCISDITIFAAKEDDYEIAEKFLKMIVNELVPTLEFEKQPHRHLRFSALLQLSDMYLREGDILAARESVRNCRQAQKELGNALEEVFSYYQLVEKEALLAVDEFDYEKGVSIMQGACDNFSNLLQFVQKDSQLALRFPTLKSEYFGDALCMQVYAMMFQQREKPELYDELCRLSDLASKQYPNQEGELERQRQYRSHIELENGNFEEAVKWLFKAKGYCENAITEETLIRFLDLVTDTDEDISCRYYLMYYLLIACESKVQNHWIGDLLHRALHKQKRLLRLTGIMNAGSRVENVHEVDISSVQADNTDVIYHPTEILFWKYASYLSRTEYEKMALPYYNRAVNICFMGEGYLTMYITGLGIEAERIWCLFNAKETDRAMEAYEGLVKRVELLLKKDLAEGTKRFLQKFASALQPTQEALWKASRMITY